MEGGQQEQRAALLGQITGNDRGKWGRRESCEVMCERWRMRLVKTCTSPLRPLE